MGIKSYVLTWESQQLMMLGKPNIKGKLQPELMCSSWKSLHTSSSLLLGSVNLRQPNSATLYCWYLALVSKSSFWYHDGTGPVCCVCIELALNCSVPLFSNTPLLTMSVWKHCCEYNSACKRKYSCGMYAQVHCMCVCLCEGKRVCLCWLVRASSCTCRTSPSYWRAALF